jgi:hypothetical protein
MSTACAAVSTCSIARARPAAATADDRRRSEGRQRQVVAAGAARRLQIGDRVVEHAEQLADFSGAVVEVAVRPVRQRLSRALHDRQPLSRLGGGRDLVERRRDVVRQRRVVRFGLRFEVVRRARGRSVAAGAIPVDTGERQVDQM